MRVRRARPEDVVGIHRLIAHYAVQGLLLPRTQEEIRARIHCFLVLTEKGKGTDRAEEKLLGCLALEPYGAELAEIRSLAVAPEIRGQSRGTRLLRAALVVARRRRIALVFAVTHAPEFFTRQGFLLSSRRALPEKLARDCRTCPKAAHCALVAVVARVCPEHMALPLLAPAAKPVRSRPATV